ncbi:MAG: holdfast anchoring protein HfaB [Alphaproteobacteria bacterium]
MKRTVLAALALSMLTACGTVKSYTGADPETGLYARPIGSATVGSRHTPYSQALGCLGQYLRGGEVNRARIAVGRISDFTGKQELEGGFKVTQGASLMAMSALAKAGLVLVERFDTGVTELELKFANNKLIGERNGDFRKIRAGTIAGSDFFLVGGITELNYNIRSSGIDGFGGETGTRGAKGFVNANAYVMDISLDLRLVDTRSMLVVDVVSYQKQIVGREVSAGVFDFFGTVLFDVSAGTSAHEPIQYAVRSVVERAILDLVSKLYNVGPDICSRRSTPNGQSLAEKAAEANAERDDPNRWHAERDPDILAAIQWTSHLPYTPKDGPAWDANP